MNERIDKLLFKAGAYFGGEGVVYDNFDPKKFSKLLIEDVLNEVQERAYYTGDRDWSDEVDRPWIQLEYGYGKLHDAKKGIVK